MIQCKALKDDTDRWLRLSGPVFFFLIFTANVIYDKFFELEQENIGVIDLVLELLMLKTAYHVFRKRLFCNFSCILSNKKYQNDVKENQKKISLNQPR